MRPEKEEPRWGAKLFVASACFKRDVLAIQPSDRHEILREHTRHTKESGSKNLLQRGILYRHEKILLRQGILQAQTRENYVGGSGGYSLISLD